MTFDQFKALHSRRAFLRDTVGGLGTIALANLFAKDGFAAADPLAPKTPHFAPTAKNVIFLFMEGAPSQIDLFDPKPELKKWHGKPLPESMTNSSWPSSNRALQCWRVHGSSNGTGSAAPSSRISCPTRRSEPMTSA